MDEKLNELDENPKQHLPLSTIPHGKPVKKNPSFPPISYILRWVQLPNPECRIVISHKPKIVSTKYYLHTPI